jgi:hypothetical protein
MKAQYDLNYLGTVFHMYSCDTSGLNIYTQNKAQYNQENIYCEQDTSYQLKYKQLDNAELVNRSAASIIQHTYTDTIPRNVEPKDQIVMPTSLGIRREDSDYKDTDIFQFKHEANDPLGKSSDGTCFSRDLLPSLVMAAPDRSNCRDAPKKQSTGTSQQSTTDTQVQPSTPVQPVNKYQAIDDMSAPVANITKSTVKNNYGTYDVHIECNKPTLKYYFDHGGEWTDVKDNRFICDNAPAMQQPTGYTVLNDGAHLDYATYVTYDYDDYIPIQHNHGITYGSLILTMILVTVIMNGGFNFGYIKRAK